MRKRLIALFLSLALLSVSAAATGGAAAPFSRIRTYQGQFSDLTADSPFYKNVSALYEYGLAGGKADGTYGLRDNLTVGQAVIFASRIHSLYYHGSAESGAEPFRTANAPQPAAEPHLLYLKSLQIVGSEFDGRLYQPATRAEMAHVLARLLPKEVLPAINEAAVTQAYAQRRFLTDVTEYTPYQSDILLLYRVGICAGVDAQGSFLPDQPITRGAAAAMLTRLADPALRLQFTPQPAGYVSAQGTTLADLVPKGNYVEAPTTAAEFDECIRFMLSDGSARLSLKYPSLTREQAQRVMTQCLSAVKLYCEQGYNAVFCTYTSDGSVTLTFSAVGAEPLLETYRAAAMEAAIAVHDQLWLSGDLTAGMSQWEKAWVYYTWICDNCTYDYAAKDDSLSHIPYSLFKTGSAVCDGYTGAYNLLLKLEGISCFAYFTENHAWTVATLDGTEYHIDTTWGDGDDNAIARSYFGMTPEDSLRLHAAA